MFGAEKIEQGHFQCAAEGTAVVDQPGHHVRRQWRRIYADQYCVPKGYAGRRAGAFEAVCGYVWVVKT